MSETENNYQETDLGNISLNPRGEYDPAASYEYLDTVSYQGGSYVCRVENETTITGTAPEPGHNTDYWQMLTLPGNLTAEAVAMHDDVVNKAAQVEISRAAVEQAQQEVEAAQADVQQLHEDTVQAAQEAENSRDSAAGYAQSAEASRKAAAESEQNINAQMTGLDEKVSESVTQAKEEIATARQQAIGAITSQQDTSVQLVKDQTAAYISQKEAEAHQTITSHTNQEIERTNTETQNAKNALDESIEQANTHDTTLKKTIQDAADLETDIGKTLEETKTATAAAKTATTAANTAAKSAQDQASAARKATDRLIAQTNHITFQVGNDGGLDLVYTE